MNTTELITWNSPAEQMPDDDLTVLLHLEDEECPVWPGYRDGDQWLLADAMPAPKVLAWANMPEGSRR